MAFGNLIPWGRGERSPTASQNSLSGLHQEISRLFDDALRQFETPAWNRQWPTMEVEETDQGYLVRAELPGMDEKDIDISFHDGMLVIRGEKLSETRDKDRTVSERYYGKFQRQLALPDVDDAKTSASFNRGVLTIALPRRGDAETRQRRIPINPAQAKH